MPYLRLTCPETAPDERRRVALRLTDAVNELLFSSHGGPRREELRERTTIHFMPYRPGELYIGGQTPEERGADLTLELSDWNLSVATRRRLAARLTPLLAELFAVTELGGVNIRFHAYAPSEFAVGGKLLSDVVPRAGQLMKRLSR